MKQLLAVLALLLFSSVAYGQAVPAATSRSYPLSGWVQIGNSSPTERGDILLSSHIEQGVVLTRFAGFSITPYVAVGFGADTRLGLSWENKIQVEGGVKLVHSVPHGLVWVGASYGVETRFRRPGQTNSAPLTQTGYWLGWSSVAENKRFPGSSWGVLGTLSATERNNFSMVLHVDQGVRVGSIKKVHVVPFAEVVTNRDQAGYDWNNRVIGGGGLKLVRPLPNSILEAGAEYLYEQRYKSGLTAGGYSLFLRLWFGRGER